MSSSARQNQNSAVSKVHNLLDQLIAEVPQNRQRPTAPRPSTRSSHPKSAELDRLFAYIERKSDK